MSEFSQSPCTAFAGTRRVAQGILAEVAVALSKWPPAGDATVLIFSDETGAVVDVDLRGSPVEIVARLAERNAASTEGSTVEVRGRGRPRLGVIAEVTLLPRHWDWLGAQPGGTSNALRRLVDQARKADGDSTLARQARDAAYRFCSAMAGDLPNFEEASRALFAGDMAAFERHMHGWPPDVCEHALALATRKTT